MSWNVQQRSWLPFQSTQSLLDQLSQSSLWPVEVGRLSIPVTGGKGKAKEEEPSLSYHAVAYVNLAPLLYPGGTYMYTVQCIWHIIIHIHVNIKIETQK